MQHIAQAPRIPVSRRRAAAAVYSVRAVLAAAPSAYAVRRAVLALGSPFSLQTIHLGQKESGADAMDDLARESA